MLPCLSVEFGKHGEQPQPPDQEQETDDTADDEHYFQKYVPLSIPEQHVGCHDGTAQQPYDIEDDQIRHLVQKSYDR